MGKTGYDKGRKKSIPGRRIRLLKEQLQYREEEVAVGAG